MEPSRKKSKLQNLLTFKASLPSHSQSALAAFVQATKDHGLPEASSSNDQRNARRELLDSCHGGLMGPLIQEAELTTIDGSLVRIHFANLLVYISSLFYMGGSFHELLYRTHQSNPSSITKPWNLMLYSDEIIPGNVLGRAERKLWAVYATFHELGHFLSHEDVWLTISLERSNFVSQLEGGICQIMSTVLSAIFCSDHSEPQGGFLLKGPSGQHVRLHFHWGICLADGAAHKQIWSSKGDAGTKFCLLCANVHARPATAGQDDDILDHGTMKYKDLILTTDQDVLQSYERLDQRQKAGMSKAQFAIWQQATGLTWNPHAIMLNKGLLAKGLVRPVSQFCHDWMHGILQGTAPVVLYHTMQAIATEGFDIWSSMETYLPLWSFPGAWKAGHLATLFGSKHVAKYKSSQKFSSQASDLLGIFPVLRHFLYTIVLPAGSCPKACQAFLAQANLLDMVHQGTMFGATTRAKLLEAAETAMECFHCAEFQVPLMKKWHWLLHMPDFLQKHGTLPSTFTTERKHKTISAYATRLQKTGAFERNLMDQVVAMEITTLREPGLFPESCQLVKPHKPTKKQLQLLRHFLDGPASEAMVASSAKLARGGTIHCNDVVVFHHEDGLWELGQVWFHLDLGLQKVALLQRWIPTVDKDTHSAKCSISNDQGFVPIESIQYPLVYSKVSDQEAIQQALKTCFIHVCRRPWPASGMNMFYIYIKNLHSDMSLKRDLNSEKNDVSCMRMPIWPALIEVSLYISPLLSDMFRWSIYCENPREKHS